MLSPSSTAEDFQNVFLLNPFFDQSFITGVRYLPQKKQIKSIGVSCFISSVFLYFRTPLNQPVRKHILPHLFWKVAQR